MVGRTRSSASGKGAPGRWGQQKRLEFVEFRLFWEGRINRSDICDHFGISVPQASLDLRRYQELHPKNLDYDRRGKFYFATDSFEPAFINADADEFLSQLELLHSGSLDTEESLISEIPAFEIVPSVHRGVKSDILRPIVQAMRSETALEIEYLSIEKAEVTQRWITPLALGSNGWRWHVRAYCELHGQHRDFVLARINAILDTKPAPDPVPRDTNWEEMVTVRIVPDPRLEPDLRQVIEEDFGMTDGVATLDVRRALLGYFCKYLQLGELDKDQSPRRQQVVIDNYEEVEREKQKVFG